MALGPARRAFSLIELLVVMAIIALMVGLTVPMMKSAQYTRTQAGEQTISVAADAARRYAVRRAPSNADENLAKYTGTAMLFAPSNEIRLLEADRKASDGTSWLAPARFGYRDIKGRDYISMPRGSGAVGIVRTGSPTNPDPMLDTNLELIAAPFAIRFNEFGYMVAADDSSSVIEDRMVFYDGDCDTFYDPNNDRDSVSNYNPASYDPDHPTYDDNNFEPAPNYNRHKLPFERIEAVLGVLVFDKDALYDAPVPGSSNLLTLSADGNGYINTDARAWLLANGKALFFNRYTGRVIRND